MFRQEEDLEPGMSSISSPGLEDYVTRYLLPTYPPKPAEPLSQSLQGSYFRGLELPFWSGRGPSS